MLLSAAVLFARGLHLARPLRDPVDGELDHATDFATSSEEKPARSR